MSLGHGDRSLSELVMCLESFEVTTVADVRSWPSSRRQPHFDREELEAALTARGYLYRWLGKELGGFRTTGYEAHMETELFAEGLERLARLAREAPTAFLCAERDPAGCHRRHIATALARRGFAVRHVLAPGRVLLPGERPEDQGTLFPM